MAKTFGFYLVIVTELLKLVSNTIKTMSCKTGSVELFGIGTSKRLREYNKNSQILLDAYQDLCKRASNVSYKHYFPDNVLSPVFCCI